MAQSRRSKQKQSNKRKKNHAQAVVQRRVHKGAILRQESEQLVAQYARIVTAFDTLIERMPEDHRKYLVTMPEYTQLRNSLDTNKQVLEEVKELLLMSDQELMENEMIVKTKFLELNMHQQNITSSMQTSGKMLDSAINDGKIHKVLDISEDLIPEDVSTLSEDEPTEFEYIKSNSTEIEVEASVDVKDEFVVANITKTPHESEHIMNPFLITEEEMNTCKPEVNESEVAE
jgi:hypothetical protein